MTESLWVGFENADGSRSFVKAKSIVAIESCGANEAVIHLAGSKDALHVDVSADGAMNILAKTYKYGAGVFG